MAVEQAQARVRVVCAEVGFERALSKLQPGADESRMLSAAGERSHQLFWPKMLVHVDCPHYV